MELTRGNQAVTGRVGALVDTALCTTALGEMYYGIARARDRRREMRVLRRVRRRVWLVEPDANTARKFGTIKSKLAAAGRPIPENDLWIAAVAVRRGFTLVTHDAHFARVPGLAVRVWPR